MRTGFRIYSKDRPNACYEQGDLHDTLDAAKAAVAPDATAWGGIVDGDERRWWPDAEPEHLAFISAEQVPESVEDRVSLALGLLVAYRDTDGDHHQKWLTDQVVRVLTGDRYEALVAEACNGEDGPDMYEWDEGIAP